MPRKHRWGMAATAALFAPSAVITARQVATVASRGAGPGARVEPLGTAAMLRRSAIWGHLLPPVDDPAVGALRDWVTRLAAPALMSRSLDAVDRRNRCGRRAPSPPLRARGALVSRCARQGLRATTPHDDLVSAGLARGALGRAAPRWRARRSRRRRRQPWHLHSLSRHDAPVGRDAGDWVRVARYIEQPGAPQGAGTGLRAGIMSDIGRPCAGRNRLIPIPRPAADCRYDIHGQVLRDESKIQDAPRGQLGPSQRCRRRPSGPQDYQGAHFRTEVLEEFVPHHGVVLSDSPFVHSRVRLLE